MTAGSDNTAAPSPSNKYRDLIFNTRRACEPPIRTCIVFLDHVQNLQIHAVRAKFYYL